METQKERSTGLVQVIKIGEEIPRLFYKKVLTNDWLCAIIQTDRREEIKTMEWIKVQEVRPNGCPCGYTEYISEDGTMGKQVWFDGYEEIYEIEK